jgi:DNA-binding NarL/FixJ family response regulator
MNDRLTVREEEIVALIASGMKNREIAVTLGTTEHMVKNWIRAIYDKSGFDNRVQLSLWYVRYREGREKGKCELSYEI